MPEQVEIVGLDCGIRHTPADVSAEAAESFSSEDEPRARRFVELLQDAEANGRWRELGDLMFASHGGYADCGIGHERADWIVAQARSRRDAGGSVFGAKLTGAGGGGTVVLLGERTKVWHEALRIKKAMLEATGHTAQVIRWSSPGAMEFGVIDLQPKPVDDAAP